LLRCAQFGIALFLGLSFITANVVSQNPKLTYTDAGPKIVLHSPVPLTPAERRKLNERVRPHSGEDDVEEIVREIYQDKGYFKAEVIPTRIPTINSRVLVLQVNPGRQYHLVHIAWHGNTVFSEDELASLIPFNPGELFNRDKIARGLEAARSLYDSKGYINFTSIPTPETDDNAGTIAFDMQVDEGGQYRFGTLDVYGMDEAHHAILLSAWERLSGRPYNRKAADKFFSRYFRSPRPNITPENYTFRKVDDADHVVDYSLHFAPWSLKILCRPARTCPPEIY
jgi:outer membrane translocation and assembly module TamA